MTTTAIPAVHTTTPSTGVRVGLVISAVLGLANIPFLFPWIDWGAEEPPFGLLVFATVLGMVSVVCVVLAWNTGNRKAIRINAAALIVNALMVLPGLFIETTPFLRAASAAIVAATLAAVVLTMRRDAATASVTD
ncbi:MAG: hypothetical protein MUE36_08515 [Acidimicrobiales bacterium]|jgi:hypothetical protein|nr:hypothetical protein [Acidimicrobiales bacterium]